MDQPAKPDKPVTGPPAEGRDSLALLARLDAVLPNPWVLFAIVVFLIVFPIVAIRGYHFEEGLTVALARDVLDGGNPWYEPHLFGYRWMERPVLLSWIVALLSLPFGEVYQVVARLPVIVAEYLGALLVYFLARPHVSRASAIFAALSFLLAPLLLIKLATAESDLILTVAEFAAFVLWWRGRRNGGISLAGWAVIGLLLGATALFKGPQPAAFFPLGVGAFLLWKRDWKALPGFALAGVISLSMVGGWYLAVYEPGDSSEWSRYMRLDADPTVLGYVTGKARYVLELFMQILPATLIVLAGVWSLRAKPPKPGDDHRDLRVALALYIGMGLAISLFWPDAKTRYAMPTLPAFAVLAALMLEHANLRNRWPARAAMGTVLALAGYQLVWNWIAAPAFSDAFARSRHDARMLADIMASDPAPLYAPLRSADMIFAYLETQVTYLDPSGFDEISAPAWIFVRKGATEDILKNRNDLAATMTIRLELTKAAGELSRIDVKPQAVPASQ